MGIFGPDAEKVLTRGAAEVGALSGIHVTYNHDSDVRRPIEAYAISFLGGRTLGVRQRLRPDTSVRLGQPLAVRTLDDAAVIDWAATMAGAGISAVNDLTKWKVLKSAPEPGIVDEEEHLESAKKKGSPGELVITGIATRSVVFGMGSAVDLDTVVSLPGQERYAVQVKTIEVPFYAGHLPVAGASLPCWVNDRRLDKVTIDWPAAAMRDPGVGRPTVQLVPVEPERSLVTLAPGQDVRSAVDAVSHEQLIGGISMTTLVAVEAGLVHDRVPPAAYDEYAQRFGVRAGTWADAVAAWQQHFRSDWRAGAAYGEAIAAAMKRR
jgi:hypothetical protein